VPVVVDGQIQLRTSTYYQSTPTTTCITPAVSNQALGTVTTAALGAWDMYGTSAGQKEFLLEFYNCPSNMQRILYKVDSASGTSPDPNLGLLPLRIPQSTAAGVVVQVHENNTSTGGNYSPSTLGTWKTLTRYDQNKTLVNYELPMRVRYFSTSTNVTPGSVEAAMTITIQYQ